VLKRPKAVEYLKSEINNTDAKLAKHFGIVAMTSVSNKRL
jgi:hypothetical protein